MIKQINALLVATFVLFFLTGCETVIKIIDEFLDDDQDEILLYLQKVTSKG